MVQIKEAVAWMSARADEAYQNCIHRAVYNEAYYRMYAAYYGETYRADTGREIASGLPAGTMLWTPYENIGPEYGRYWLEGEAASFFTHGYSDDDENSQNGYQRTFATARPIPTGAYSVITRAVRGEFKACNYTPQTSGRLYWTITVTAPTGTVHEAFFDPASTSLGVGFSREVKAPSPPLPSRTARFHLPSPD